MSPKSTLMEQIQRNTVALISLAVAVTSLGYNTWRNEASEYNRNQRLVAIELLLMLGDLQQLTLDRQYGADIDGSAILRQGWSKVLTIRDLAQIAAGSVPSSATDLYATWDTNNQLLGTDVVGKERIIDALEGVRRDVHALLKSLD